LEVYEKAPESEVPSKAPGVSSPAVEGNQPLKKFSESRREEYAQLLKRMHENSSTPQRFTPAMQRIAKSMEHISEPNKFLTASESLRIQRGQKDFIAQGLRTAPKYLPAIEKEFAGQKVPVELSKLAFIESSFNLKALSKVGASGVYQIMPETGKQYLRIQDGIDERNDPIKAGRAAARILRFYYDSIGSWPLAITAYNHGVGGIRRAMGSVGSDRLEDLIVRYEGSGFGFASKNFYTGFLAILATLAQKDQHFPGIKSPAPLRFKVVQLPTPIAIDDLQKLYRMSAAEILRLNPDISPQLVRNHGSLPKNFHLKISGVPGAQLATANSGSESQKK
jgi:membrane-bound lytic murein transglycosylase D